MGSIPTLNTHHTMALSMTAPGTRGMTSTAMEGTLEDMVAREDRVGHREGEEEVRKKYLTM